MRQTRRWLRPIGAWLQQSLWHRLNRGQRRFWSIALAWLLVCLSVRLLPYLAPIRAADLVQDQQAIEFTDRQGLPLGTLLTRDQEHTAVVPLAQVSPQFVQAILAAEDGRFYQHGPLDLRALARALAEAAQARRVVSGASTITMQLARMIEPLPRSLAGKAQEIWLAWRLAAGLSKDEILQAYVNRLPMGGNVYGVEAAARTYFGIPASDLNAAQASLLAALPNDPTRLNPYERWDALKQRQRYVLKRMVQTGQLDSRQAERAYAEVVLLQPRSLGILAAPHFLFWLAGQLPQAAPQVRTTLDRPLQQFVEAQVQQVVRTLGPHNAHHAAALVIDNHSAEVLAYVGSPDYFAEAQMGRNDGVQALRQPGSTLKPFLYALALEKRVIRPNTILADVPTHYAIPGARLYSPTDYSETFQGPVRVRVALANSLNVPAVRVLERVGVPNFLERLHRLGFEHLNQSPEYYGLGLSLGSGEVSLWELARAYLALAKQGQVSQLRTRLAEVPATQARSPIGSAVTWALITDMLGDAHARARAFGVDSVLSLPFAAAVKTGTSSDFRDTWTVGFTADYTVAVWVGNFNGEPMRQVSGVMGAAPLWNRILLHLHEQREPTALPLPQGLVRRPICALSGLRPTPDCEPVVQEYFYPEDLGGYEQSPAAFSLPREYDEWLAKQSQPRLAAEGLKIVSPREGDWFVLHSREAAASAAGSTQRLKFQLAAAPNQPVEWWLNGRKLATQSTDALFWPLRPGSWTLQVKSGSGADQVSFQVQLADQDRKRRGFSRVGSSGGQDEPARGGPPSLPSSGG